jgi:glucans biosynthesis protein
MERVVDPMHPAIGKVLPLFAAPRCLARTRSGTPCHSPKVNGKSRCRMHGGAKGSGGPKGPRHGRYRHGQFTCEAVEERRRTRALISEMRAFVEDL